MNIIENLKRTTEDSFREIQHLPFVVTESDLAAMEQNIAKGLPAYDKRLINEVLTNLSRLKNHSLYDMLSKIGPMQCRAVEYIHSPDELTIDSGDNPIVDVLTLISLNLNALPGNLPMDLQLCIKGSPMQKGIYETLDPLKKQDQFSKAGRDTERKTYRTLARFNSWQTTLVRGMYLIAQSTANNPTILYQSLQEYVQKMTKGQGDIAGMALGLLEVLNNANLIPSVQFAQFAGILKQIVLDGVGGYEKLKQDYHYRIVDVNYFWETQDTATSFDTTAERRVKFFPQTTRWDNGVRDRQAILDKIRRLTPHQALVESLPGTEDSMITSVVSQKMELSQARQRLYSIEKSLLSHVRTDYENYITGLTDSISLDADDTDFLSSAVHAVLLHFDADSLIKKKLTENPAYAANPENLSNIPLVNWLISLKRDPTMISILREWTKQQPDSLYLLFKMGVYDVAELFYASSEKDFLFDADYKTKAKLEDLTLLVNNLYTLAQRVPPNLQISFAKARTRMVGETKDFLTPKRIEERKRKLIQLFARRLNFVNQFERIYIKDIIKILTVNASILTVLSICWYASLLSLPALGEAIAESIPRKNPPVVPPKPLSPEIGPQNFGDELHSFVTQSDPNELLKTAAILGITGISLVMLYKSLPLLTGPLKRKIIDIRIKEAFSNRKEFDMLERRLVIAAVLRLAYTPYNENFATRTAQLFQNIQDFSVSDHENTINWFLRDPEGVDALRMKNPVAAFKKLLTAYDLNLGDFQNHMTQFDFIQSYELASIIHEEEMNDFLRGIKAITPQASRKQRMAVGDKNKTILSMLRLSYARGDIPAENIPYFNSIATLLGSLEEVP